MGCTVIPPSAIGYSAYAISSSRYAPLLRNFARRAQGYADGQSFDPSVEKCSALTAFPKFRVPDHAPPRTPASWLCRIRYPAQGFPRSPKKDIESVRLSGILTNAAEMQSWNALPGIRSTLTDGTMCSTSDQVGETRWYNDIIVVIQDHLTFLGPAGHVH